MSLYTPLTCPVQGIKANWILFLFIEIRMWILFSFYEHCWPYRLLSKGMCNKYDMFYINKLYIYLLAFSFERELYAKSIAIGIDKRTNFYFYIQFIAKVKNFIL